MILENKWKFRAFVTIKQFKSHTTCCSCCTCCTLLYSQFPISSQRYWEYLIMGERDRDRDRDRERDRQREKSRYYLLFIFSRNSEQCHHSIVKYMERVFNIFWKSLLTMVGQRRKFLFLEPLKRQFHHSENTLFEKQKKNKSSQRLVLYRKMQPCKLSLQRRGTLIT